MKTAITAILLILLLPGCSTTPKKISPSIERPTSPTIDYLLLQSQLGIVSARDQVGLQEKHFDACNLGSALPQMKDCHKAYFVLIQFQLSCRALDQPEGVLEASDLRPVVNQKLKWQVGLKSGNTQTGLQGYGEIRLISQGSSKNQYLRISTGKDFLMMRAGQATNLVTPPSWCE